MLSIDRAFVTSGETARLCAVSPKTEIEFHSNFMPVPLVH